VLLAAALLSMLVDGTQSRISFPPDNPKVHVTMKILEEIAVKLLAF
jgi:hypothetical protein